MSKTHKKKKQFKDFEEEDFENEHPDAHASKNKRAKKRFDRALKTLDLDELLEFEEEDI